MTRDHVAAVLRAFFFLNHKITMIVLYSIYQMVVMMMIIYQMEINIRLIARAVSTQMLLIAHLGEKGGVPLGALWKMGTSCIFVLGPVGLAL